VYSGTSASWSPLGRRTSSGEFVVMLTAAATTERLRERYDVLLLLHGGGRKTGSLVIRAGPQSLTALEILEEATPGIVGLPSGWSTMDRPG
jgi:hypothetical protein